jgi:hypothetical protein
MAPRSDVWDSHHKILIGGILMKAKCKYCGCELDCHSKRNGTTSLKYFLGVCKNNPNKNPHDLSPGCSSVDKYLLLMIFTAIVYISKCILCICIDQENCGMHEVGRNGWLLLT